MASSIKPDEGIAQPQMAPSTKPDEKIRQTQTLTSKRTLRVDRIYSRKDRQVHFVKTTKSDKKNERFNRFTLVVRRIIAGDGTVSSTEVDIKSPMLVELLREILKDTKCPGLNRNPPNFAPEILYHTVPALQKRKAEEESKESPDPKLLEDINEVIVFIHEDFGPKVDSIESLHHHGQITYEMLWTLFAPGSTIIERSPTTHELQAFKFSQGTYEQEGSISWYDIDALMIHHDGEDFGWAEKTLKIPAFNGAKAISSLDVFPLQFNANKESLQQTFINRGTQFPLLIEPVLKEYEGMAVEMEIGFGGQQTEKRFYATGRVMIDPVAFKLHLPNSDLLSPWICDKMESKNLKHEDTLFCSRRVLGFGFETKKWGAFDISSLREVSWDVTAMNKLILEEKRGHLITSLIKNHKNDDSGFDDIVRGKGRGLVGLLSGSPGVGKTLTAEVVAELSKRPLYAVTAGELGTTAVALDQRLGGIMSIVHRWGCVLLIDEADIFLHKRGDGQIEQNALVSVFLRRLEYFQGIIILTTNRRQDIDEAFKSRIHLKFHYPPLDVKGRLALWTHFLSGALYTDDPTMRYQALEILAQRPLNGREIKNAVSCTLSVIASSGKTLTLETIEDVLDTLIGSWDNKA